MLCATHILGGELYGDYTLALAITGVLTVPALLGFTPGVLPFLSKARQLKSITEIRAVVRSALLPVSCVSLILLALLLGSASWLGENIFDKPELEQFLLPLGWLVLIGGLSGMVLMLLQGFLLVKERAWIERVIAMGVTGTGMALTWRFEWGVTGVVTSTLAGAIVGLVLGAALLTRKVPGILQPSAETGPWRVRRMLSESWPLMGTSMLAFLLLWTDVLLMGVFRESGEVGVYGACARLAPAIMLAHESLGPIFIARLSDLYAGGDWVGIRHLYRFTARWAIWPGLALASALALWSTELLSLFGPEFSAGATVLIVLAGGKAVATSMGISGRVFAVTGKARINLINMLLLVGGNVILNLLWIPDHGALGAAAATSICLATVRMLQVAELWLLFRIIPWDRRCLIPVLGILAIAGATYPFREGLTGKWGWLLPMSLFFIGCAVLFLLAGVGKEDREVWRAVRGRLGTRGKNPARG